MIFNKLLGLVGYGTNAEDCHIISGVADYEHNPLTWRL